jgi:CPA1 family monovalent cation:H+ antiporter
VGSLLLGWAAYIGAEALSFSGVLATVACGLVVGWRQHVVLRAETRIAARATWRMVTFVLESLVFILIGLSLRGVLERLDGRSGSLAGLLGPTLAIVGAVIASRFVWVIPTTYVVRAVLPRLRRRDPYPPLSVPIVISWAGMRGVVSLAAALALPTQFPGRDFILAASFAVILVTVLVQGLTLAPLIRILKLERFDGAETATLSEADARARLARAQLAAIQRVSARDDGSQRHPRLLEQFSYRARVAERFSAAEAGLRLHRHEHFSAVLTAIEAGRAELVRLHRRGEIHDRVLHALETELDLEETAARRYTVDAE